MNDDYQTKAQDVVCLLCSVKRDSFPLVTLFQNGVRAQDFVCVRAVSKVTFCYVLKLLKY
jgi:hypothetical protein